MVCPDCSRRPGSSPLARGLPAALTAQEITLRIIPARAGFTPPRRPLGSGAPDHPRSRGVYISRRKIGAAGGGSSPLARGLRRRRRHPGGRMGIIPARAGFTGKASRRASRAMDHPRSRGVYDETFAAMKGLAGSSPLARGLLDARRVVQQRKGIIPARAGFTGRAWVARTRHRDHPRSRGVYSPPAERRQPGRGSSPLARGLLLQGRRAVADELDHPRSRGVYTPPHAPPGWTHGSSPLARGLHPIEMARGAHGGIIPARAGFTSTPRGGDARR